MVAYTNNPVKGNDTEKAVKETSASTPKKETTKKSNKAEK